MLLRRSRFARIVSRTLIAALVLGLLPVHAEASRSLIPQAPPSNLPQAPSHLAAVVVSVDGVPCAVVIYAEDPSDRIKYHRARWMEPGAGRFLGMDRWVGDTVAPATLHRYLYATSSPVQLIDPSGYFSVVEASAVSLVLGTVLTIASLGTELLAIQRDNTQYVGLPFAYRLPGGEERVLAGLHPRVAFLARQHLHLMKVEGLRPRITWGLRTFKEQDDIYAQGRFGNPGKIVTRARGGESYHNFGVAYDIALFDRRGYIGSGHDPAYRHSARIGVRLGLEWGGDFKSLFDAGHFQLTRGASEAEMRRRRAAGQDVLD